jgi:flagellin-like protein
MRESAVSPVIGTILLVAITVVLVAVIAAVVMGMAGNTRDHKDVGLTVTSDAVNDNVTVLLYGGMDVEGLAALTISIEDVPSKYISIYKNGRIQLSKSTYSISDNPVGQPFIFHVGGYTLDGNLNSRITSDGGNLYYEDILGVKRLLTKNPDNHYWSFENATGERENRDPGYWEPVFQNKLVSVTGNFTDGTQIVLAQSRITL